MKRRIAIGLASLALTALMLPAQPAQKKDDEIYNVGNGVTSPRLARQVEPEYPKQGFRITGTVLIGLIVNAKGEPENVHVARTLDKDVDQAAIEAVRQWRFEPATKEGKAVAVKISVEIRFHGI